MVVPNAGSFFFHSFLSLARVSRASILLVEAVLRGKGNLSLMVVPRASFLAKKSAIVLPGLPDLTQTILSWAVQPIRMADLMAERLSEYILVWVWDENLGARIFAAR